MSSAKDIEFSKLLIAKGLVSRAEMQRHLDDLEERQNAGKNISLQQILLDAKVLSELELRYMQAPKKRVLHCCKCHTMYRAQEEDIGKKFKCKKCGTWVMVPSPGQTLARTVKDGSTQKTAQSATTKTQPPKPKAKSVAAYARQLPPSVAAIQQEEKGEADEMTLMLGLDGEELPEKSEPTPVHLEATKTDTATHETAKSEATKPAKLTPSPAPAEVTIMVDLDESNNDQEEAAAVIDEDAADATLTDPHVTQPALAEIKKPVTGVPVVANKMGDVKKIQPPKISESTVMLDLDEDEEEEEKKAEPEQELSLPQTPVFPAEKPAVTTEIEPDKANKTPKTEAKTKPQPPKAAIKLSEPTVMLDLDEDAEAETEPQQELSLPQAPPVPAERPAVTAEVEPDKAEVAKPVVIAKAEPDKVDTAVTPKDEPKADKSGDSGELDEWALSGYGGEDSEKIDLKMQLDLDKYKQAPVPPPQPYLQPQEEASLHIWATGQAPYLKPQEDAELDAWASDKAPAGKPKSPQTTAPASPQTTVPTPVVTAKPVVSEHGTLMPLPETPAATENKTPLADNKESSGTEKIAPAKKLERILPPKPPKPHISESTIMLDLDEEKDDG